MALRTQSTMRKAVAFTLTVVPGLGHVVLDRHAMGVLLFSVFAVFADGVFVGANLWVHEDQSFLIQLVSTIGLLLIYPHAFLSIWRLTFGLDEGERARTRMKRLRKGIARYLRGELDRAEQEIRVLLKQDDLDVDCLFYLAMIHRDRGETAKARRAFRRCAALDRGRRWEARREIESLRAGDEVGILI